MVRITASVMATLLALATTPHAYACREFVPNAEELATYPAPVVVAVTSATRVEDPGWNTWRIVAETPDNVSHTFITTLTSNGCGRTPLPPRGETWVLYFEHAGSSDVVDAFPLAYVRAYDPRLADLR